MKNWYGKQGINLSDFGLNALARLNHKFFKICTLIACVLIAPAGAQENAGSNGVVLAVDLELGYRDNITRARLDDDKISSLVTVITPSVGFVLGSGANEYTLNYDLGYGTYKDSSIDDYTDHTLEAAANFSLNARNRLSFSGDYLIGHDERGAGFSQGFGDDLAKLDTYVTTQFDAVYNYGASAIGSGLELRVGASNVNYDARLVDDGQGGLIDSTLVRNRTNQDLGITYSLGVSRTMALQVQANARKIEYDVLSRNGSLDSSDTTLLMGATWEGTAKTTGTVSLGYGRRNFADPTRQDFSGPRWEASIEYLMRTYSVFTLTSAQSSSESRGLSDFISTTQYGLSWRHEWGPRVSSSVSYSLEADDYEGIFREDNTQRYRISINYALGRSINLRVGFSRVSVNSNENVFDYDSNLAFIGITATL